MEMQVHRRGRRLPVPACALENGPGRRARIRGVPVNLGNFNNVVYPGGFLAVYLTMTVLNIRGQQLAAATAGITMIIIFMFGDVVNVIVYLHDRNWAQAAFWVAVFIANLLILRFLQKNGKLRRTRELLGAKSRALREKLEKKMRHAAPHPAPVPVRVRS